MHIMTLLVVVQLGVILFGFLIYLLRNFLDHLMVCLFVQRWRSFQRVETTQTVKPIQSLSSQSVPLRQKLFNYIGVKKTSSGDMTWF